jgi:uncharacterized protein (TIGR00375 family)
MFIADFHIHSKYSRATSPKTDLEHLSEFAKIKGIDILATGDFTHPQWLEEIKDNLESAEDGLYKLKSAKEPTRFILSSEISCIYSKAGSVRKVHIVVLAPSIKVVEKINAELAKIGNLKADGRPILGLDAKKLAEIVLNVSQDCLIIPAHVMTPYFGVFGSKSGFDSLEECFEDYTKYIYAMETGLSADPAMLWRLPDGRRTTLLSNSDAHSPGKLGREANVFEGKDISYFALSHAIKEANRGPTSVSDRGRASGDLKLAYTIEFFPQEGKYHYDGHRECDVSLSPEESKKYNNICPVCGKPMTIGVMNRIDKLADKPEGFKPKDAVPFKCLVPLLEIIGEALNVGPASKRVAIQYNNLIEKVGTEFHILLDAKQEDMAKATTPEIAEGIIRVRQGKVNVEPGYDGVFGKVRIFSKIEKKNFIKQKVLF